MTPVIFVKLFDDNAPVAVLPTLPGDHRIGETCLSYAHIGQHGTFGLLEWTKDDSKPHLNTVVTMAEGTPLLDELRAIGYDDLQVFEWDALKDYWFKWREARKMAAG